MAIRQTGNCIKIYLIQSTPRLTFLETNHHYVMTGKIDLDSFQYFQEGLLQPILSIPPSFLTSKKVLFTIEDKLKTLYHFWYQSQSMRKYLEN